MSTVAQSTGTRKERSATIPTKSSTSSTSSTSKSKRVLVYDFAENKTRRMSRTKFEKEYSGVGEIVTVPIPKGASRLDLSPEDLTPQEDSQEPPEFNASYIASVHIPNFVFWARALAPSDPFPELTVVSNSTPNSSRSNTEGLDAMNVTNATK